MFTPRLVFLASFLVLLSWQRVQAITPRLVWFDRSCHKRLEDKGYSVQGAWTIITSMKNSGIQAAQGTPDWNLYEYIFRDIAHNNANFIQGMSIDGNQQHRSDIVNFDKTI